MRPAVLTAITCVQQLLLAANGVEIGGNVMVLKLLTSAVMGLVEIGNR